MGSLSFTSTSQNPWSTMSDNHPPVTYWYVNATHLHRSHQYRWMRDASSLYITVAQAQTSWTCLWPCGWHFLKETGSRHVSKRKDQTSGCPSAVCPAHIPLPLHQACFVSNDAQLQNRGSWTRDSLMMSWKRWSHGCCKRAKAQHVMDKSLKRHPGLAAAWIP